MKARVCVVALTLAAIVLLVLEIFRVNSLHQLDEACLPHGHVNKNFTLLVYVPNKAYSKRRNTVWPIECPSNYPNKTKAYAMYATDNALCQEIADVVVWNLRDVGAWGGKPLRILKEAIALGRRPTWSAWQTWIATALEAAPWARPFTTNQHTMALFDVNMMIESGQLVQPLNIVGGDDGEVPSFAERERDVLLLVSNCNTVSKRETLLCPMVERFTKGSPRIDSLGKCCGNNATWPSSVPQTERYASNWRDSKQSLLMHYKFELIVQNALCPFYVDEKLMYALEHGTIPIYLGASNAKRYDPADLDAGQHPAIIYMSDFATVDELWSHVARVASNATLAARYHEWRKSPPPYWPRFADAQRQPMFGASVECRLATQYGRHAHAPMPHCNGTWETFLSL